MKKKILAVCLVLVSICILSSCGPSSVKGKWTDSDKQTLRAELQKQDWSKLGDNKNKFIDCYMSKVEQKYNSINELAKDTEGNTKISTECANQFLAPPPVKKEPEPEPEQEPNETN
jgi:peptidoglycan hydrolase CwlO-like protein